MTESYCDDYMMTRLGVCIVQVEQCSVRLLGQIDVRQGGFDTMVRWPFKALSISEPDLAGALIRLGQARHPQQASHALITCAGANNMQMSLPDNPFAKTKRQHSVKTVFCPEYAHIQYHSCCIADQVPLWAPMHSSGLQQPWRQLPA